MFCHLVILFEKKHKIISLQKSIYVTLYVTILSITIQDACKNTKFPLLAKGIYL